MHTHIGLYREVCLSSRGFLSGLFCQGVFCLESFVRGGFCPSPFCQNTSVRTESKRSLSILKIWKAWRHMLLDPSPLSQTVTPSRTPSSATYFMDGPYTNYTSFKTHSWVDTFYPEKVLGQNGSGQNGTDKMVWTKWYTDKMVLDKMVRTKWYG